MKDLTETIQLEDPKGEITATIFTKNGTLIHKQEFYITLKEFKGATISYWDNWDFIKALYKDLKNGKKNTDRIKSLKEDIETLDLTKKDVKKFLKKSFKLLKKIK